VRQPSFAVRFTAHLISRGLGHFMPQLFPARKRVPFASIDERN